MASIYLISSIRINDEFASNEPSALVMEITAGFISDLLLQCQGLREASPNIKTATFELTHRHEFLSRYDSNSADLILTFLDDGEYGTAITDLVQAARNDCRPYRHASDVTLVLYPQVHTFQIAGHVGRTHITFDTPSIDLVWLRKELIEYNSAGT